MTSGVWSSSAFESFLDPTFFDQAQHESLDDSVLFLTRRDKLKSWVQDAAPSPTSSHSSLESDPSTSGSASSPASTTDSPTPSPTISLFPITTLPYPTPSTIAHLSLYDTPPTLLPLDSPPPATLATPAPTAPMTLGYTLPTSPKAMSRPLLAPSEQTQARHLATMLAKALPSTLDSPLSTATGFVGGRTSKQKRQNGQEMRVAAVARKKGPSSKLAVVTLDPKQERLNWLQKLKQAEAAADVRLTASAARQSSPMSPWRQQ
ncbi:hypothetical protein OIO90_002870 [Microbotryomycetes sp. JL221]|nr:hypothetical protein OIO90_002870 [Microbotryomycetes sp. JL221]